ncbi:DNA glycosylase/AP lyase ROS1-like [Rutidosis leptorrhynchoides]|uniref:DNA glycosylase/AP lyase ROS1-like n=1 Tax=Rutidosis leptorrhynchoides TaxID=125765 RepID=UPI003A998358
MDMRKDGSYQGYPVQVPWAVPTPASHDLLDPKLSCENGYENHVNIANIGTSFGCWDGSNVGLRSQISDHMKGGIYDTFLMDNNNWSGIPCSHLLALADAATVTKAPGGSCPSTSGGTSGGISGDGCGSIGDDGYDNIGSVDVQFRKQDCGSSRNLELQQYTQPERTRFLFDLNSPPILTDQPPQLITNISSQLTPVTPKQTRKVGRERMVSDIINDQPELFIEQTPDSVCHSDVDEDVEEVSSDDLNLKKTPQPKQTRRKYKSNIVIEGEPKRARKRTQKPDGLLTAKSKDIWELEVDEDFEEDSSDDSSSKRTVQPKQRRRKHRPKVVIEGEPKSAKKGTPKPDGSSTVKSKDVKKSTIEKSIELTKTRPTRTSCRKKIYFEDEWDYEGTEIEMMYESQIFGPITPDKLDIKDETKNICTRAKRSLEFSRCESLSSSDTCSDEDALGICNKSLKEYLPTFTNFPPCYKKRRTEKYYSSINTKRLAFSSVRSPEKSTEKSTVSNHQSYKSTSDFGRVDSFRKKRSKGVRRVRDLAEFAGLIEGKPKTCMELLATDFSVDFVTKKRTKRNYIVPSSSYHSNRFLMQIGFDSSLRWKKTYDIDALINQFDNLGLKDRVMEQNRRALVPYKTRYRERNSSLVLYQHDRSVVPYDESYDPFKGKKERPKVDIDDETTRVWRLLLEDINSEGIDGTDEDMTKRWEEERNVFSGRAASFIARMHLIQGDRRFSKWKGSVVDSVIGVFLTQNVSDHLSSSAFINLAAKYPPKSEPLCEDKLSISVKEPCESDQEETLLDTVSYEEKEAVNSNELESISYSSLKYNEGISYELECNNELKEDGTIKHDEKCVSEHSEILAEIVGNDIDNSIVEKDQKIEIENLSGEILEDIESNLNEYEDIPKSIGIKKRRIRNGKNKFDWDSLRRDAQAKKKRVKTPNTADSVDYEAVRRANVDEISDTIKDRGMNNMLAERIKAFLNRLVKDHGSIDLEWLRDVPPDKAKEYLLSFRGLGLKSVECVRLLTLHHLAFPVDTNVGRIAVRLGWVPLQPLPESLQLHLLELYPVLESIQQYLWPRLCKLDQKTLYELHYQMITFGKVFCTKNKPNCNSCPLRGECRHFASAFASARLPLPAPPEKSIVTSAGKRTPSQSQNQSQSQSSTELPDRDYLSLPPANQYLLPDSEVQHQDPIIEQPTTPEPTIEVPLTPEVEKIHEEFDIEDFSEDPDEIPTIKLNMEAFTQNLQNFMENNMELAEGDMSRALVALTSEAASLPTRKLKNVSQLRTEHQVYELPDSHPLLEGFDVREPDDPCSYLLAIWTPGETAESIQPPKGQCSSQESGTLCLKETCFLCNSIREANSKTVRGTLLIPCRTAMRGSFPLNGTYFQVNEVFADHDSSLKPIDVPRFWLWNLPRRTVYFGTSIPTIFRGLTTEGIQYCFWRGFVCVRGFDRKSRAPRPLMARLHFPVSKLKRTRGGKPEEE